MGASPIFTQPDTWTGGGFEILIYLGASPPSRIRNTLAILWNHPLLWGCWLDNSVEPHPSNQIHPQNISDIELSTLYGVGRLPNGDVVACSSTVVQDDLGTWIYFGIPLGALGQHYPIGTYPFEEILADEQHAALWIIPMSSWLADIGAHIFREEPFNVAVIGFLMSMELDQVIEVEKGQIPELRWNGFLRKYEDSIIYFPPNNFDVP